MNDDYEMYFDISNLEQSDWLVQLRVFHPNMKDLPKSIDVGIL